MKREEGFFARNYSVCWKFFCDLRWFMVFALGIFSLIFIIGFTFPIFFRQEIFEFIEKLILSLEGKNVLELVGLIFFNNLKASFIAIVSGVSVGIIPLIIAISNGYLLGFVSHEAVSQGGILVMWQLFPHGIFELPAVLFSLGIGFKIGYDLFGKNMSKKLKYNFKEGMRFFVFVVFPLLLVAGIIEGLLIWAMG